MRRAARFSRPGRSPVPPAEQHDDRWHEQGADAERVKQHPEGKAEADRLQLSAHNAAARHREHAEGAGQDEPHRG
jgi:hypothetical protein